MDFLSVFLGLLVKSQVVCDGISLLMPIAKTKRVSGFHSFFGKTRIFMEFLGKSGMEWVFLDPAVANFVKL